MGGEGEGKEGEEEGVGFPGRVYPDGGREGEGGGTPILTRGRGEGGYSCPGWGREEKGITLSWIGSEGGYPCPD